MRYFPGAARKRVLASLAGLTSLAVLAVPFAHADDGDRLKHEQKQVEGKIDHAEHELHEASQQAARAARAYEAAHAKLGDARARLARVNERLVAAREQEAELARQVAAAEARLEKAAAALAEGRRVLAEQQAAVRDDVLTFYTQGDPQLRAIGSFLESASLEDISRTQVAENMIVGRGTQAYEQLAVIEAELTEHKREVKAAALAVEERRADAEAHLLVVRGIYDEARDAKVAVEGLVLKNRQAKWQAIQAKRRDAAQLQALKQREARIRQQLLEIARRQAQRGGGFTGQSDGFLSYPVNGTITSPYGYRTHPIYGYYSLHNGTDFGAACGQPLVASAAGTVIDTYFDSVYGHRLFLNVGRVNGKSLVLVYNHLSGYRAREGQRVGRGDVVGYVGNTGWSTGCHLHFTVMANGSPVDPMNYL